MLHLNHSELTNPTAQLINGLKHQLVAVIVNGIKKLLKLVHCQIPYDLAKPLVFSGVFAGSSIQIS